MAEAFQTICSLSTTGYLMKKRLLPFVLFLLFFLGMALIQFATPDMPDNDGFYHIKLAWLMRTEGLKPDFPYLPLSILNEHPFYITTTEIEAILTGFEIATPNYLGAQ